MSSGYLVIFDVLFVSTSRRRRNCGRLRFAGRYPAVISLLVGFLLSSNSAAWGQDQIGVFFDEAATVASVWTTVPSEEVVGYLSIVNPSDTRGIGVYWGTLLTSGAYGLANLQSNCNITYGPYPTMVLGCEEALPYSSVIVLVQFTVLVETPETEVDFYFTEGEGFGTFYVPGAFDSGERVVLTPMSGGYGLPVARINGNDPIATQNVVWGSIKSLYR